jgi:hypothetical protein
LVVTIGRGRSFLLARDAAKNVTKHTVVPTIMTDPVSNIRSGTTENHGIH